MLALGMGVAGAFVTAQAGLDPADADVKYDWLSAKGSLTSNAYADIFELAEENGVRLIVNFPVGSEGPFPHPRTPGAVLMAIPLLAVGYEYLFAVSVGATIAAGVLLVALSTYDTDVGRLTVMFALLGVSAPFLLTLRFSGQAAVVAVVAYVGWVLLSHDYEVSASMLIAVSATVKLFPLILIVPMLLARRFKAVVIACLGFIGLNGAGLLLPGVGLQDSTDALMRASEAWLPLPTNGSVLAVLARWGVDKWVGEVIVVVIVVAFLIVARRHWSQRLRNDPTIWLALGLVALPLSWTSYDMVLVPAVACGLWDLSSRGRLTAIATWGLWIGVAAAVFLGAAGSHDVGGGMLTLLTRLVIIGAWCFGTIGWDWERSNLSARLAQRRGAGRPVAWPVPGH